MPAPRLAGTAFGWRGTDAARNGSTLQRRVPTMADVEPPPAEAPALETAPAD
jgi:hypothetical protein